MDQRKLRLILTPVTLLALVGLLGFGAWWGYKQVTAPLHPPTPCVVTSVEKLTSKQVVLRVLNGGFTTGLGGKVADELEKAGFTVLGSGNSEERVKKTVIVAAKADSPEAKLVLGFFKDATIKADPTRIDGQVTVLVGSEYGGMNANAPREIAVPGGNACLPVAPTAGATPTTTGTPAPTATPTATASR